MEKQNKPDWKDVPDEYDWIAQDSDGEWVAFKKEPNAGDLIWWGGPMISLGHYGEPQRNPDWGKTKERRPTASTD